MDGYFAKREQEKIRVEAGNRLKQIRLQVHDSSDYEAGIKMLERLLSEFEGVIDDKIKDTIQGFRAMAEEKSKEKAKKDADTAKKEVSIAKSDLTDLIVVNETRLLQLVEAISNLDQDPEKRKKAVRLAEKINAQLKKARQQLDAIGDLSIDNESDPVEGIMRRAIPHIYFLMKRVESDADELETMVNEIRTAGKLGRVKKKPLSLAEIPSEDDLAMKEIIGDIEDKQAEEEIEALVAKHRSKKNAQEAANSREIDEILLMIDEDKRKREPQPV